MKIRALGLPAAALCVLALAACAANTSPPAPEAGRSANTVPAPATMPPEATTMSTPGASPASTGRNAISTDTTVSPGPATTRNTPGANPAPTGRPNSSR